MHHTTFQKSTFCPKIIFLVHLWVKIWMIFAMKKQRNSLIMVGWTLKGNFLKFLVLTLKTRFNWLKHYFMGMATLFRNSGQAPVLTTFSKEFFKLPGSCFNAPGCFASMDIMFITCPERPEFGPNTQFRAWFDALCVLNLLPMIMKELLLLHLLL